MLPTQFATRFIDWPWTTRRWPPVGITIETGGRAVRAGRSEPEAAEAARVRVRREPLGRPVRLEPRLGVHSALVELVLVRVDEIDVVVGDGEDALDGDGVETVAGVEPGDELCARARER